MSDFSNFLKKQKFRPSIESHCCALWCRSSACWAPMLSTNWRSPRAAARAATTPRVDYSPTGSIQTPLRPGSIPAERKRRRTNAAAAAKRAPALFWQKTI